MAAAPRGAGCRAAAAVPRPCRRAEPEGHVVKSPMVGTFYRSASPGIEVVCRGRRSVNQGDTLCIVEAMKLMNEIESDAAGRSRRSWSRTASRSSSASRCSSSNRHGHVDSRQAVRQDPDRQSRRDRAAHPARLPRAGHQDRRRPFGSRSRRQVRQACRRIGLHRPASLRAKLPEHPGDHQRGRSDRRPGHPSRATASCPKTPISPRRSRARGFVFIGPRPRRSG